MVATVRVKGVEKVLNNLNREIKGIKGRTYAGLLEAGLIVQADSQRRVPVEYGKLRASAYTQKAPNSTDKRPIVEVGYSAAYALYVHENMEQKLKGQPRPSGLGVYWGPKGEPKFLENALKAKKRAVLAAIRRRAKDE